MTPPSGSTGSARKSWCTRFHFTRSSCMGVEAGDWASENCRVAGAEWPCGIVITS
ncbi:hypothetical protein JS515_00315 [Clavibacter sp. DM3]|nr:hypothetical protein [Clavibacter zhangzhiyongii]